MANNYYVLAQEELIKYQSLISSQDKKATARLILYKANYSLKLGNKPKELQELVKQVVN